MIRHLPNLLTALRVVCSFLLLCFPPDSARFLILYLCCGLSDALDGYFARKFGVVSRFGAMFDSIADMLFFCILLVVLVPLFLPHPAVLAGILAVTLIRLLSLSVGYLRFHAFAALHTYANKLTGFALFCLPVCCMLLGVFRAAVPVCILAGVSAVEELLLNLTRKELRRDVRSIFDN